MTTSTLDARDVALVRRWAAFYRARGWNPLPARDKRPLVRYAEYWDAPAPAGLFDRLAADMLQLMTGRRWRLLAIDLDGDEAAGRFRALAPRPIPPTWATHSGGGGLHLWFMLPADFPRELPRAFLWRGEGKHSAIERLCDRSLIVAPPSIHPRTGHRYRFLDRARSPARLPLPAPCPDWILRLPPVEPPRATVAPPADGGRPPRRRVDVAHQGRYRAADVLDAIPDKVALVRYWGVDVASARPNLAGWCPCRRIEGEDRNPSASVSATTGRYWEPGARPIGLFELAARLGVYGDWRDAVADLGARYGAREVIR